MKWGNLASLLLMYQNRSAQCWTIVAAQDPVDVVVMANESSGTASTKVSNVLAKDALKNVEREGQGHCTRVRYPNETRRNRHPLGSLQLGSWLRRHPVWPIYASLTLASLSCFSLDLKRAGVTIPTRSKIPRPRPRTLARYSLQGRDGVRNLLRWRPGTIIFQILASSVFDQQSLYLFSSKLCLRFLYRRSSSFYTSQTPWIHMVFVDHVGYERYIHHRSPTPSNHSYWLCSPHFLSQIAWRPQGWQVTRFSLGT